MILYKEVQIWRNPARRSIELVFYGSHYVTGARMAMTANGPVAIDPKNPMAIDEAIEFDEMTAQGLVDQLWACGLRPTEGSGSAGSLAATEKHLQDMRALVRKSLDVELPRAP